MIIGGESYCSMLEHEVLYAFLLPDGEPLVQIIEKMEEPQGLEGACPDSQGASDRTD
jgi:hypothetical protein